MSVETIDLSAAVPGLTGRRVIVYGATQAPGEMVVAGLRAAGATVAVTSASTEGAELFALKRVASGGAAQAVDLDNATNVRVATRKLAKQLGGVDVTVVLGLPPLGPGAVPHVVSIAAREVGRDEGGRVVVITAGLLLDTASAEVQVDVIEAGEAEATSLAALALALAAGGGGEEGGVWAIEERQGVRR